MDEITSGSLSIDTFLSKQEGVLVEYIRKFLQAETRIVLLETGLQELHKKNKELNEQIETNQVTIKQSLAGLQAVTVERDRALTDNEKLRSTLAACNTKLNDHLVLQGNYDRLKESMITSQNDYSTLKDNYNIVLSELEAVRERLRGFEGDEVTQTEADNQTTAPPVEESEPAPVTSKKSKKVKSTEPEWTDGQY
jgi:chromosome segregation ATPase